ncbi:MULTISPECIES: type II toxin-antitoxin system VapC family toxin [Pseudomonadota]|uniref:type II toxin-antitoxin system VapC family toxin n=1 Tax=Pseudomonadota TaxID=1224 RepID=UPI001CA6CFCD|nr:MULTISPECIES: type II toxin-antitoxin system VapC family toxin [Pseudomonadota]MBY8965970.1 type II toxin-antitoxin system VapC family toxin [Algiphilus acroporae]MCI5070749.1 type II toxin-antitoxin system VapC family toxin [Acidovorax sp.]MCI5102309.1 type II toxin-antitoxin system VapC family toxin [Algiphilus sp.]
MNQVLVDSNVLLDVLTDDAQWYEWSASQLEACAETADLCINPLVYAEVSVGFNRIEELEDALPASVFRRVPLPWDAGFLAGKANLAYRSAKGTRSSPLPDFHIGTHAAIAGMTLLTRDAKRYQHSFPKLALICP